MQSLDGLRVGWAMLLSLAQLGCSITEAIEVLSDAITDTDRDVCREQEVSIETYMRARAELRDALTLLRDAERRRILEAIVTWARERG